MTLEQAKAHLAIDFDDDNDLLIELIARVEARAKSISGLETLDNAEIQGALLDDIAVFYQNRGEANTGSLSAFNTYRRHSVSPMF